MGDVHGGFKGMIQALDRAGFNPKEYTAFTDQEQKRIKEAIDSTVSKMRKSKKDQMHNQYIKTIDNQVKEGYTIREGDSNYYEKDLFEHAKTKGLGSRQKPQSGIQNSPLKVKFKEEGKFFFPDTKIASPADIAFAFQQLKNSAREKSYIIGLKNGKPVSVECIGVGH